MVCAIYIALFGVLLLFFFKQKTAYEMRISDWSSDVCSSDLQYGRGVERDLVKAAELYRAAAEQGLAEAQHNLGYLYERGLGVGRNPAEAAVWSIGRAFCWERGCQFV